MPGWFIQCRGIQLLASWMVGWHWTNSAAAPPCLSKSFCTCVCLWCSLLLRLCFAWKSVCCSSGLVAFQLPHWATYHSPPWKAFVFLFFFDRVGGKVKILNYLLKILYMCACVCAPGGYITHFSDPRGWSSRQLWGVPCGCWEPNRGPLQEQKVLFTAEPALQLQDLKKIKSLCVYIRMQMCASSFMFVLGSEDRSLESVLAYHVVGRGVMGIELQDIRVESPSFYFIIF